jgi:hypothetical protein
MRLASPPLKNIGTLKKKLGLTLASAKEERGRVYRIAEPASA